MERNDHLEKENAYLKEEGDRMEKALKQGKRDVHQLKGKHDGLSTTVTEISRALVSFLSFHFILPVSVISWKHCLRMNQSQ